MLSHSSRSNPPTASFDSANGPSVTRRLPSRTRTVFARRGGASWSPICQTPRARRSTTQSSSGSSGSRGVPGAGSSWPFMCSASQQISSRYLMSLLSSVVQRFVHDGRRSGKSTFRDLRLQHDFEAVVSLVLEELVAARSLAQRDPVRDDERRVDVAVLDALEQRAHVAVDVALARLD